MSKLSKKLSFIAVLMMNIACVHAGSLDDNSNTINLMTFNVACLPAPLGIQVNGDILRPNTERALQIAHQINQFAENSANAIVSMPNIIAFEEAFDPDVRTLLKQQLATHYPYNSGTQGEKALNAGSGLLLFSQYPILSIEFHPYTNLMVGDEMLANKGFIIAKLKYNNDSFITVIITHLESGDAIDSDRQSQEATTSVRRGEQMGRIYAEIQTKATQAPNGYENLKYLKTFVLGDFNTALNNVNQQKSISTGLADDGYKAGQIAYPGQYWLFSVLKNTVPSNFLDVRVGETVDPGLLQTAITQNKFIGSTLTLESLQNNKRNVSYISRQGSEYDVIDGIFATEDGAAGEMQTQLVSLNEWSPYKYEMSDHLALMGRFVFLR